MNMFKLLLAFLAVGASAYMPAVPGTKLAQSKLAQQSFAAPPMPAVARSSVAQMNAVTERDADGNPVTHFEMLDAIWLGVIATPFLYLLVTNPF